MNIDRKFKKALHELRIALRIKVTPGYTHRTVEAAKSKMSRVYNEVKTGDDLPVQEWIKTITAYSDYDLTIVDQFYRFAKPADVAHLLVKE
jgi:hypothetical protein